VLLSDSTASMFMKRSPAGLFSSVPTPCPFSPSRMRRPSLKLSEAAVPHWGAVALCRRQIRLLLLAAESGAYDWKSVGTSIAPRSEGEERSCEDKWNA
jgi:hypothetical protein